MYIESTMPTESTMFTASTKSPSTISPIAYTFSLLKLSYCKIYLYVHL